MGCELALHSLDVGVGQVTRRFVRVRDDVCVGFCQEVKVIEKNIHQLHKKKRSFLDAPSKHCASNRSQVRQKRFSVFLSGFRTAAHDWFFIETVSQLTHQLKMTYCSPTSLSFQS